LILEHEPEMDVTIVIPVFNQLEFTRQCLESLAAAGYDDSMIAVVNNASTDGTAEFLATRPKLRVIHNPENRACAAAWNQGFEARKTKWTVFLNNDTVLSPGWLESLVAFAEKEGVDIASPAISCQRCGRCNGVVPPRVYASWSRGACSR
jgi:GT2 family glycosyltransferase